MKAQIIEMLDRTDERKMKLVYFFIRGLLGYKKSLHNQSNISIHSRRTYNSVCREYDYFIKQ